VHPRAPPQLNAVYRKITGLTLCLHPQRGLCDLRWAALGFVLCCLLTTHLLVVGLLAQTIFHEMRRYR
jgi:hypothetical protein